MTSVSSFPNPLALTDITLVQTVPNMLSHIQSLTWTMDETLVSSEDGVTFNSLIQELQTYNIDTAWLSDKNTPSLLRWLNKLDKSYGADWSITERNIQIIGNQLANVISQLKRVQVWDITRSHTIRTLALDTPLLSSREIDECIEIVGSRISMFEKSMNQITDPLIRNEAQRVFEMLKDLPLYLKAYTHEIDVDAREHDLSLFTQFSGGLTLLSEELLDLNDATFFDTNARLLLIDRYTQYTRDALGFVVSRARLPGEQRLAEIF